MVEKDMRAYWQGKHTFSLKTPLTPLQVEELIQPTIQERYYGTVQEGHFELKKIIRLRKQRHLMIDGRYQESDSGTRLEIIIWNSGRMLLMVCVSVFMILGLFVLVQTIFSNEVSNLFPAIIAMGFGLVMWSVKVESTWQEAETEMKFISKLLDEAEGTLLNAEKQIFESKEFGLEVR